MMDFIMVPAIIGIITLGIYKMFELFARRKERLAIIEKLGDKFDPALLDFKFTLPGKSSNSSSFGTLKIACLLLGIGLGLLVGFFIVQNSTFTGFGKEFDYNNYRDSIGIIYGASVLLFGGLGLLVAFIVEIKNAKKQ
jgi:hypothetical protein